MENKRSNIVYVNPNFSKKGSGTRSYHALPGGMYLNPNFKDVHDELSTIMLQNTINEKNFHNIHINPRLLQMNTIPNEVSALTNIPQMPTTVDNKSAYIVNNKNKLIRINNSDKTVPAKKITTNSSCYVSKAPSYSLVRKDTRSGAIPKQPLHVAPTKVNKVQTVSSDYNNKKGNNVWDNSQSYKSKASSYSIVRKDTVSRKISKKPFYDLPHRLNKKQTLMSADKRASKFVNPCIRRSVYTLRKRLSKSSLTKTNRYDAKRPKVKRKMSNEEGICHSRYKLQSNNSKILKNIPKFVYIGGERYVINKNILRRVKNEVSVKSSANSKQIKKINLCGITYVRKSENIFVMDNRLNNSMAKSKKINITCPIFRRFGICKKKNEGKCPLIHDPKYISVCQNFLKGKCDMKDCFLSHQVVLEKMPACKFYLEGCCTKENCVYLHVKVNQSANICVPFLKGYCEKGVNCENKHFNVCPDYFKKSECNKLKCPYPHKMKSSEPHLADGGSFPKYVRTDQKTLEEHPKTSRYFEEKGVEKMDCLKDEISYKGRSKLGDLPSFISLSPE